MHHVCVRRRGAAALVAAAIALAAAGAAHAETAWVRGESRLNVRTGPGPDYRIIEMVKDDDPVQVVKRQAEWTRVRTATGNDGWVPSAFLVSEAPPAVRVGQLEAEAQALREKLASIQSENQRLSSSHAELATRDATRAEECDRIESENKDLKAGQRWPFLITGAGILASGLLAGMFVGRANSRRSSRRLRL
jgi:SH3 domain protein